MANTSHFANAHHFVIGSGGNFATVHGNQILNYFNREPERKKALTMYDQFNQVISGNIYRTKDFGVYQYPRRWDSGERDEGEEGELRADKIICAAEVIGVEGKMFTVVAYSGPDARETFENIQDSCPDVAVEPQALSKYMVSMQMSHLFSSITVGWCILSSGVSLISRFKELRPLASFVDSLGFWGRFYLRSWMHHSNINWWSGTQKEVWMDTSKGILCRGLPGPECELYSCSFTFKNIPSDIELLRDDICFRFLSSLKSNDVDQAVIVAITSLDIVQKRWYGGPDVSQPTVFSMSTNATIAVGTAEWTFMDFMDGLEDREVMENGESSDLSDYKLIMPTRSYLNGHLSDCQEARRRRRQQPIYLFVHPPDFFTPTPFWTNTVYKHIHDYQIARGFDPTTPDFARFLRYRIFQVQHDSHRFEEAADAATTASSSTLSAVTPPNEVPSRPSNIDSNPILSTLICPDPALEASYTVFASGSNTISPESTSNSWLGGWSPGHSQRNTQPPPLPHGVSPPFNNQPLHVAGASAVAYTTPIYSHASHAGFDFPFGATYPNAHTGWNTNLWSGPPYGQYLPPPPNVSSLGPPT
ncbi:hypothetical protein V5O48_018974, partial [Marasmius crinis-equi]